MNIVHINTNGISRVNGGTDGHLKIVGTLDGNAKTYYTHLDSIDRVLDNFTLEEKFILRMYFAIFDAGAVTLAQKKAALENKDWRI
jgi:hypothetical protein